jgi:hypothetical protein
MKFLSLAEDGGMFSTRVCSFSGIILVRVAFEKHFFTK